MEWTKHTTGAALQNRKGKRNEILTGAGGILSAWLVLQGDIKLLLMWSQKSCYQLTSAMTTDQANQANVLLCCHSVESKEKIADRLLSIAFGSTKEIIIGFLPCVLLFFVQPDLKPSPHGTGSFSVSGAAAVGWKLLRPKESCQRWWEARTLIVPSAVNKQDYCFIQELWFIVFL